MMFHLLLSQCLTKIFRLSQISSLMMDAVTILTLHGKTGFLMLRFQNQILVSRFMVIGLLLVMMTSRLMLTVGSSSGFWFVCGCCCIIL